MKNNEIKEYKIPEKDAKDMSNLEVINKQITRIISKMNKKGHLNAQELVMLSNELRELVELRCRLQVIEEFEKRKAEMIESDTVKSEKR